MAQAQAEMDLFLDALRKNDRLLVKNNGNGMRNLFFAGEFIGVRDAKDQHLETGMIVLGRNEKFYFGARILSGNATAGWEIKTDCGYGTIMTLTRQEILAVVDSFQIENKMYPIWGDQLSLQLNKKIARLSQYVVPVPPYFLLSCIKRKFYKWRVRKTQLLLRKHICSNQQPLMLI